MSTRSSAFLGSENFWATGHKFWGKKMYFRYFHFIWTTACIQTFVLSPKVDLEVTYSYIGDSKIFGSNDTYFCKGGSEWYILARMLQSSGWVGVNFAKNLKVAD